MFALLSVIMAINFRVVVALLAFAVLGVHSGDGETPVVKTHVGKFAGSVRDVELDGVVTRVHKFLGVPYAEPPTDELRWRKPATKAPLVETYDATNYGAVCPQTVNKMLPLTYPSMSEDCLFLNVIVPVGVRADLESGYPVMVYIHGGGFSIGASNDYKSDTLSAYGGIILVTVNYRLGIFGFLTTEDEEVPSNLGLWDQQLAIRWVHDNIAAFGGDADRMTLFGESAGAIGVMMQALYAGNQGLFRGVISQSGSATWATTMMGSVGAAIFFGEQVGCPTDNTKVMVLCLKSKSTEEILHMYEVLSENPENMMNLLFLPRVDGDFISAPPMALSETSEELKLFRSVNFLTGVCSMEGGLMINEYAGIDDVDSFTVTREAMNAAHIPGMLAMMGGAPNVIHELVQSEYTDWKNPDDPLRLRDQYVELIGDIMMHMPTIEAVKLHANHSSAARTYMYQLSADVSIHALKTASWIRGSNHGDDIPFVFGFEVYESLFTEEIGKQRNISKEDLKWQPWEHRLNRGIMTMWANFAKSGNPNIPSDSTKDIDTTWPAYTLEHQEYLDLGGGTFGNTIKQRFRAKRDSFWTKVVPAVTSVIASVHAHDESSPFVHQKSEEEVCTMDGSCTPP